MSSSAGRCAGWVMRDVSTAIGNTPVRREAERLELPAVVFGIAEREVDVADQGRQLVAPERSEAEQRRIVGREVRRRRDVVILQDAARAAARRTPRSSATAARSGRSSARPGAPPDRRTAARRAAGRRRSSARRAPSRGPCRGAGRGHARALSPIASPLCAAGTHWLTIIVTYNCKEQSTRRHASSVVTWKLSPGNGGSA